MADAACADCYQVNITSEPIPNKLRLCPAHATGLAQVRLQSILHDRQILGRAIFEASGYSGWEEMERAGMRRESWYEAAERLQKRLGVVEGMSDASQS